MQSYLVGIKVIIALKCVRSNNEKSFSATINIIYTSSLYTLCQMIMTYTYIQYVPSTIKTWLNLTSPIIIK